MAYGVAESISGGIMSATGYIPADAPPPPPSYGTSVNAGSNFRATEEEDEDTMGV